MRTAGAVLAAVGFIALMPSNAPADGNGTYTNWLCFDRDTGKGVGTSPEVGSVAAGFPLQLRQSCNGSVGASQGIVLDSGLPAHTNDHAAAGLTWTAPPGIKLSALHYWRALRAPGNDSRLVITENGTSPLQVFPADVAHKGETFYWYGTNGTDGNVVNTGTFDNPFDAANGPVFGSPSADGGAFYIAFGCESSGAGGCDVPSGNLDLRIFSAQLTLQDNSAPQVSNVGGSLAVDNPVRGVTSVSFNASDTGSGVYRAILLVDGVQQAATDFNTNGGGCADVNPTNENPYEFGSASPCKTSLSGTFNLDTSSTPDGARHVQVLVEDAAGNRAIAIDRTITVDNQNNGIGPGDDLQLRGDLNGQPAADDAHLALSWSKRKTRTSQTVSFGRAQHLGGQLTTADGRPIAQATIDVGKSLRRSGATETRAKSVVTDANGHFEINFLKTTASYGVRASYRSRVGDTIPVATASATLVVRAGVSLKVSPKVARRGTRLRFSGRLAGGLIPVGGKQVILQVRAGSRWATFRVLRTRANGQFVGRYALPSSAVARYVFRALSKPEAAYPFVTGHSGPRTVVKTS